MIRVLLILLTSSLFACNSSNTKTNITVKDSLNAVLSSEESIITYADGLNLLKENLDIIESPIYKQANYIFYFNSYLKDSVPVIYEEHIVAENNDFTTKTYFLENGELLMYQEKSKHILAGENPSITLSEQRIFYRNNIFLKADERFAESDSLLKSKPFIKIDDYLIDKNITYDFSRIENGLYSKGEFNLGFDKLIAKNSSSKTLILNNHQGIESSYQVTTIDSLIIKIENNPELYKGTKLSFNYRRKGNNQFYISEKLTELTN